MTVGGDVSLPTPLAPAEAPWVWLFFTLWAVLAACMPLVWVFRNRAARSAWLARHDSVPWPVAHATGAGVSAAVAALLWLFVSLAFWVSRGGHEWKHRITIEVTFYAALGLLAVSTVPVLFARRTPATLLLCAGLCVYIACTVSTGIALPWYAGVLAALGCVAWIALIVLWTLMDVRPARKA